MWNEIKYCIIKVFLELKKRKANSFTFKPRRLLEKETIQFCIDKNKPGKGKYNSTDMKIGTKRVLLLPINSEKVPDRL